MKLYLDDIRPAPPGWHRARTAAEAVMHLGGGDVEELSLDHDLFVCALCEEEGVTGLLLGACSAHDRGDGLQVVDWMIRTGVWPRTKPVVHSANAERAAIMRDRIEAYWRPRADLEASFHRAFSADHIEGEWFQPSARLRAFIDGLVKLQTVRIQ